MSRLDVQRRPKLIDRSVELELADERQTEQGVRISVARHQAHGLLGMRHGAGEVAPVEEKAREIALSSAVLRFELDRAAQRPGRLVRVPCLRESHSQIAPDPGIGRLGFEELQITPSGAP